MTKQQWANVITCAGQRCSDSYSATIHATGKAEWANNNERYEREQETFQSLLAHWRGMPYPLTF